MLSPDKLSTAQLYAQRVAHWIQHEGTAKSTLAGAVVLVDALAARAPLRPEDVFTDGGQLTRGRGSALRETLERYGEPRILLADGVTSRSTRKFERLLDELDWGRPFQYWSQSERIAAARILAEPALAAIRETLQRERISLTPDRRESPVSWLEELLESAKDRSQGRVEQHLVGAKLQRRLPYTQISDHAAHAGDVQTSRAGDFVIGDAVFHVTAAPAALVIEKCKNNLRQALHPILIVPRAQLERAKGLAAYEEGLDRRITFVAIEDFIATNIIEIAGESNEPFFAVLSSIIDIYNQRIEHSESDPSLRIALH